MVSSVKLPTELNCEKRSQQPHCAVATFTKRENEGYRVNFARQCWRFNGIRSGWSSQSIPYHYKQRYETKTRLLLRQRVDLVTNHKTPLQ